MKTFGVHEYTTDGLFAAVENTRKRGCTALQVFLKQKLSYNFPRNFKALNDGVASSLKGIRLIGHSGLITNIISAKQRIAKLSIASVINELDRASMVGASDLVMHPGSAGKDADREDTIQLLVESLVFMLRGNAFSTRLLLETMPGAGGQIGNDLSELSDILMHVYARGVPRERLGVCLDTCHTYTAGYNFASHKRDYERFMSQWEQFIGFDILHTVHLNGAWHDYNSKKDGHASLCGRFASNEKKPHRETPAINPEFFGWILKDPRLDHCAFILETPVYNWDADLAIVRNHLRTE